MNQHLISLLAVALMSTETMAVKMRSSTTVGDEDYLTILGKSGASLHDSMLNFIQGVSTSTEIDTEIKGAEESGGGSLRSPLWNFLQESRASRVGGDVAGHATPLLDKDTQQPTKAYKDKMVECAQPIIGLGNTAEKVYNSRYFGAGKCVVRDHGSPLGKRGPSVSCYAHVNGVKVSPPVHYKSYMYDVWCPAQGIEANNCDSQWLRFENEVEAPEKYFCNADCQRIREACTKVEGCGVWPTIGADMCVPKTALEERFKCESAEYRLARKQTPFILKATGESYAETCAAHHKALGGDATNTATPCVPDPFFYMTDGEWGNQDKFTGINKTPLGPMDWVKETTESESRSVLCRPLAMVQAMVVLNRCDPRNVGNKLYKVKDWLFIQEFMADFFNIDLCIHISGYLLAKYGISIEDWPVPNLLKTILKPVIMLVVQGLDFLSRSTGRDLSLTIRFDQFATGAGASMFSQWFGGGGGEEQAQDDA